MEDDSWLLRLGEFDVCELDAALAVSERRAPNALRATRADFPLEALARTLEDVAEALRAGRGMYVLRGLPVRRWGVERTARFHRTRAAISSATCATKGGS
jgi:hypothetical protein